MSEPASDDLELPPRRETFLARYPRKLKLAVTAGILVLAVGWSMWDGGSMNANFTGGAASSSSESGGKVPVPGNGKIVDTDTNAPALNNQDDRTVKLVPAPDGRVTEDTADGSLPRISEDGLRPWQIYARPFNPADKRPRIAIVIADLGLSRAITDQAISQLPPTMTLSFSSQSSVVGAWVARARQDGHEVLLQVPMEPFDYPRSDPGPGTLLTSLPNSDNLSRLLMALRRATGYVGITTLSGSRLTTDSTKFMPILDALRRRGLMVFDARVAPHSVVSDLAVDNGVPVASVTQRLDGDLSPEAIQRSLDDLEKIARQNGRAVGIAAPTPIMLSQLQIWAKGLPQRGVALAPLTAMVQ